MVKQVSKDFVSQADGSQRRNYASYEEYVKHQSEKIDYHYEQILQHDREYEQITHARFLAKAIQRSCVLCLGARLGGEVRAFRQLDCLAIGIDLNPGPHNLHVLVGDVHALQFADAVFDVIFTNILDHIYDSQAFFSEILRVAKPGARIFFEINLEKPTRYEAVDISDESAVLAMVRKRFSIHKIEPVHNKTSYVDWQGLLVEAHANPPTPSVS